MFLRQPHLAGRAVLLLVSAALLALAGCAAAGGGNNNGGGNPRSNPGTQPVIKNFFGLDIHNGQHFPSQPFGYWRLWDAAVDWAHVEPARGTYDFSLLDQYVSLAESKHVQLLYVLGNTPSWSATDPTSPSNERIPGASSPPKDIEHWHEFVQTLATRYKGRIQAYEVWNEIDLPGYWTGTVQQAIQMAQVAYNTIKGIDSGAMVMAPSLVGHDGPSWLQQFLSGGGAQVTDAIPYHLYNVLPAPEDALTNDKTVLAIATQFNKPLWDTEEGVGPWGGTLFDDQNAAAAFVARTLILQTSLGISHVIWYAWDDRGGWVHLFLVGPDFVTPTPAGNAFFQVQGWLQSADVSCSQDQSDFSWQCTLSGTDGTTRYAVWNPLTSETFAVPSSWNVGHWRDVQGNSQAITGGQVDLGASPILLEP